jgi:uncharacterized Zn-binding protein involved in type VI secretion
MVMLNANGKPAARVQDAVLTNTAGTGQIIHGSTTVLIGD